MQEEALLMDVIVKQDVVPPYVSYAFLSSAILIGVALAIRGSLALVPKGLQNFVEVLVESLMKLAEENIGHKWGMYFFPLIGTIGLYILVNNFMGLIPGFTAPTSNINCTASMAIPVFLATHYYGVKVHGVKYIKHFTGPIIWLAWLMLPIEVIGHIVRPLTLSVRLFGNMIAKHMILFALAMIAPIIIPVAILGLGVLVSLIQAFVFVLLTSLYLAGSVEEAH
ncbi:MAG TPA: F0F1 ATP synthase subunit A [Thermodesulfovibrionales bacterium]|nr:F0F1 ATP synthase subunit A [Thermodesulfovibrionales bacterium]